MNTINSFVYFNSFYGIDTHGSGTFNHKIHCRFLEAKSRYANLIKNLLGIPTVRYVAPINGLYSISMWGGNTDISASVSEIRTLKAGDVVYSKKCHISVSRVSS